MQIVVLKIISILRHLLGDTAFLHNFVTNYHGDVILLAISTNPQKIRYGFDNFHCIIEDVKNTGPLLRAALWLLFEQMYIYVLNYIKGAWGSVLMVYN